MSISQEQTSLAPSVMLSAVTKRLVKKLGADAFSSQDSVEDNMRKVDEGYVCGLFYFLINN